MTLTGSAEFAVLPIFKDFERKLIAGVSEAAQRASKDAKPIEVKADTSQIESAFSKLGDLGRVIAGVAVVAGLKHAIETGQEWAGVVGRIARASGDSVENSSKLAFVLDRVGIGAEKGGALITILNKNLQQGADKFSQYFDAATFAELRTSSFIKQIPILAAEYQKLNVGQERTNFLFKTFGRSGQDLDKLLKLQTKDFQALADEAARFGLVIGPENAASFKAFVESQRAAEQASKGLQVQLGLLTLPVFEKFDEVMVKVLTTLTNLPAPVQALIGTLAIGAIGIGKYGQSFQAAVQLGQGFVKILGRLIPALASEGVAITTVASAALDEALAHSEAAVGVNAHAAAEERLLLALRGVPAAEGAAAAGAAAEGAAVGGGILAGITGAVGAALGADLSVLIVGAGAVVGGAAIALGVGIAGAVGFGIGTVIEHTVVEPILDAIDRAKKKAADKADVFNDIGAAIQRAIDQAKPEDVERTAQAFGLAQEKLRELDAAGQLTPPVIAALTNSENLKKIRDTAAAGGDVAAVIDEIVANATDGVSSLDELGATVGDFAVAIGALRQNSIDTKAAQEDLNAALQKTGVDTEAGTNVLANYAQKLFEAAQAAAAESGAEFDAAAARRDAAAAAVKAGEDFLANQEKIRDAAEEGQKRIADAEERLGKAIADAAKRNKDAQENLADAISDRVKRIADAEEKAAETKEAADKRVKDARQQLRDFEVSSARRIADAERAVVEARKQRTIAITDATIALERAQAAGDAEAEAEAERQLTASRNNKGVADAERDLTDAKAEREKGLADLRAALDDARLQRIKDIQQAEEDLAAAIEEANKRVQDARERADEAAVAGQEAIKEAQDGVQEATDAAIEAVAKLGGDYEVVITQMQIANREALEFEATLTRIKNGNLLSGATSTDLVIANNASGGPIREGEWSWVGENGPELRRFGSPGDITSTADIIAALRQMTGSQSGGAQVNVNVAHQDPNVLANVLKRTLVQGLN